MKKLIITLIHSLVFILFLASCEYNFINPEKGDPVDPEVPILFSAEIEPIWTTQSCTSCHNGSMAFSLVAGQAYNSLTANSLLDLDEATNSKILTVPGSSGLHADKNYAGNQPELIKVWIEQGAKNN